MNKSTTSHNGFFLSLEGPEGAGKSTQGKLLAKKLRAKGHDVLEVREPGGTPLGEELRRLIKHFGGPESVCDEAELLMFGASRAQLVDRVIIPHLKKGGVVICDRFADSTTAYQAGARGVDPKFVQAMHSYTVKGYWPDMTLFFDLNPSKGRERAILRSGSTVPADRLEAESLAFHQQVYQSYLQIAKDNTERYVIIDADRDIDSIQQDVQREVLHAIS